MSPDKPGHVEIDAHWLETAAWRLDELASELRTSLGREPDSGDLLLILSGIPDGTAAKVLAELGVSPEAIQFAAERARGAGQVSRLDEIEAVRQQKELALEAARDDEADSLRDAERQLTRAWREHRQIAFDQTRERLGITLPPDPAS